MNRALQGGMQERTILGIGGAAQEPTQPGMAPGIRAAPRRVSRETQIGVVVAKHAEGAGQFAIEIRGLYGKNRREDFRGLGIGDVLARRVALPDRADRFRRADVAQRQLYEADAFETAIRVTNA